MRSNILLALATLILSYLPVTDYAIASEFCFEEAGQMYGINPIVLKSIAKVESNYDPAALNKNTNGTYDVGLMQINTIWKPLLGKERWNLLENACFNTKTGAWILAMCINKYGYNWKALGCYHSQTPELSEQYAKKVFSHLQKLKEGKEAQPLDANVEAAIQGQIEDLVVSAQQGKTTRSKKNAQIRALYPAFPQTAPHAASFTRHRNGQTPARRLTPAPANNRNAASATSSTEISPMQRAASGQGGVVPNVVHGEQGSRLLITE